MRITVELDDALFHEARGLTGIDDAVAVVEEALAALVQRQSSRNLARLGATEPHVTAPNRRRTDGRQP